MTAWRVTVLTVIPEAFPGVLGISIPGRALAQNLWQLDVVNIRDYAYDKHHTVDDTPYGGGAGMVLRADVLATALDAVIARSVIAPKVFYLSPRAKAVVQADFSALLHHPHILFVCGRYEGVDERFLKAYAIQHLSLGDFVLSGGEPAAMAIVDGCVRLIPGALGNTETLAQESHTGGLLEYPHYTRPAEWRGMAVPDVLLSGHHAAIAAWRHQQAEQLTQQHRPDMWQTFTS